MHARARVRVCVCVCVLRHFSPVQLFVVLCSPPGSSVPGVLQAGTLEWVAMLQRSVCTPFHVADLGRLKTQNTLWEGAVSALVQHGLWSPRLGDLDPGNAA